MMMLVNRRVDVLVVGAGPIGLVLACHLRRLGLSVVVVEKRSGPSAHSKAIGLQYRVSEVLARLGVVDRFITQGGSPTSVNIYAGHQRLVQLRFVAPAGISGKNAFQPRAILIPQSQTEAILIEYLQELGGSIEWETEFLRFDQHSAGVLAQVQSHSGIPREIDASWLVSCEGAHSVARKQAAIAFRGKTYPLAFFMADVRMKGSLKHEENHVWLHSRGSLAALPLPAVDTWRLFVEVTRQDVQQQTIGLDDIRRFMAERAPGIDSSIVGDALWLSEFRINCRMVDRMREGRVFLAGDAAHIHSPTGGQGITTGMQDAVNLAWKLARVGRGAPQSLLDTYEEERLPHAAEVLRETDRTTSILFAPNPILRALRDRVVLPVLRKTWVQRRMFGKLSQLHVHYRRSSLSVDSRGPWHRRRLRAGDRAPDVAFGTPSGGRTTLFALMSTLRPIAIVRGTPNASDLCARLRALDLDAYVVGEAATADRNTQSATLLDVHGDFGTLYGLGSSYVCLIRPDGHVGLILVPDERRRLQEYLERICEPSRVRDVFSTRRAQP
jgi:2-polyprenyl-6-methoxyphenol hydroxylase-like FAD-dependent oxidoreductase